MSCDECSHMVAHIDFLHSCPCLCKDCWANVALCSQMAMSLFPRTNRNPSGNSSLCLAYYWPTVDQVCSICSCARPSNWTSPSRSTSRPDNLRPIDTKCWISSAYLKETRSIIVSQSWSTKKNVKDTNVVWVWVGLFAVWFEQRSRLRPMVWTIRPWMRFELVLMFQNPKREKMFGLLLKCCIRLLDRRCALGRSICQCSPRNHIGWNQWAFESH